MRILLTGGAGYIGSHTCVALAEQGFEPVILDDLSRSSEHVLPRLQALLGRDVAFELGDVCDARFVATVVEKHRVQGAIHFAAYKSIPESTAMPVAYFRNNVGGLLSLLEALDSVGARTIVYSSSAAVYGAPDACPIREDCVRRPANPYAASKAVGEDVLHSVGLADARWRIGVLRYFNPVGAHPSGSIGEDTGGRPPGNLMPSILQVAAGHREQLACFGGDYPTRDGTGVRDYIHVMDLVEGHVACLGNLLREGGILTLNLGTGRGYTVLETVKAFEAVSGRTIPLRFEARRPGDVAECWADPSRAAQVLGWRASRSLEDMCRDAWKWQVQNPLGYKSLT